MQKCKMQIPGGQNDTKGDLPTQHDAGSSRGSGPWWQHNSGHFPTGIQFNLIDSDLIYSNLILNLIQTINSNTIDNTTAVSLVTGR